MRDHSNMVAQYRCCTPALSRRGSRQVPYRQRGSCGALIRSLNRMAMTFIGTPNGTMAYYIGLGHDYRTL